MNKAFFKAGVCISENSDLFISANQPTIFVIKTRYDYGAIISQVWQSCWLWEILIVVGCVLSQLKLLELYIHSCEKGLGLLPRPLPQLRMKSSSFFILYWIWTSYFLLTKKLWVVMDYDRSYIWSVLYNSLDNFLNRLISSNQQVLYLGNINQLA